MASKKAEGMLAPLLDSDDESSTDASSYDSDASSKIETEKRTPMQKLKELVVYVGLGGGAALSAGAIVLNPAIAIFVMGGVCLANVPYAAFKERRIGAIPSLRSMNNKLREDANKLGGEVDILSEEIDLLEPEADRASAVEEQLRSIADLQGANVNRLVELVRENETILAKMRDNLRQRIVQDMIAIVVKSDQDNDCTIDRMEAKTLALRIRLALQEYGVMFDSQKFIKAIGGNTSVSGIIDIVTKLLPTEKKQKVEKEEDSDSDSDSDWDSDSDEEDDLFDMFHMAEDDDDVGGLSLMTCDKKRRSRTQQLRRESEKRRASQFPVKKKNKKRMETVESESEGDY
eukprot:CAMPEP_0183709740 /NCGR_PEP_ID=MMETSP0737-20130205/5721_1 /TAXON_ID=385413 /ORGANISM="Thalassiosira miniscula, Strain CCMP1093" /LENGTH=344 /DNA_ID=CAMNT_0025937911 /DNA_START=271 /DNA_END=1305 /DNA_ORIENTATION=-